MTPEAIAGSIVTGLVIAFVTYLAGKASRGIQADATSRLEEKINNLERKYDLLSNDFKHLGRSFDRLEREFKEFRGGPIKITRHPDDDNEGR